MADGASSPLVILGLWAVVWGWGVGAWPHFPASGRICPEETTCCPNLEPHVALMASGPGQAQRRARWPFAGGGQASRQTLQQPVLRTCDFVSPPQRAFSERSEQEALLFSDPGRHGNSCGITAWAGVHLGGTHGSSAPEGTWAPAQGHTRCSLQASLCPLPGGGGQAGCPVGRTEAVEA